MVFKSSSAVCRRTDRGRTRSKSCRFLQNWPLRWELIVRYKTLGVRIEAGGAGHIALWKNRCLCSLAVPCFFGSTNLGIYTIIENIV